MAEPRYRGDYRPRQVEAARRVLVDLGQVLAGFEDCLVLVGGWVPDLLLPGAAESHVGSIDVDLALDARKLTAGRYADLEHLPGGMKEMAANWRSRRRQKDVARAIEVLREKFSTVQGFGPRQVAEFHGDADVDARERHARRAFELVIAFLGLL